MDFQIAGRTALVTGGGAGIGASIAKHLAAEGVKVVVADISQGAAEAQAAELKAGGAQAIAVGGDVTKAEDVEAMVARATEAFGGVDILVNNAGFTRDGRITKMSEADFDSVIDVMLKGAFLCARAVLPGMSERNWGRIINMSSRAHLGNRGQANYSAAKAGLIGFTKAMALEWGRNNITVNAIAPGLIGTTMVRSLPHFDNIREAAEKNTPIPRIGDPEDVAAAVTFLASDRAGYITGEVVHVTGGRYG